MCIFEGEDGCSMKKYEFLSPETIIYGKDALLDSGDKIKTFGDKALIVTDQMMTRLGYTKKITDILQDKGIEHCIYDEVNDEPIDLMIQKGAKIYKENNCEFLITLGGGSPIDAAKAIGILVTNPGKISDYMGQEKVKNAIPPLVAIPTTAGTGSEATKFTIITNTESDVKMLVGSPLILPDMAIVDCCLTLSVPPDLTAATGIDALTHAIEAYTSVKSQPLSDQFALSAIRRIAKNLKAACINGNDKEARDEMMLASLEAGIAFSNSSVTLVHGMSRPIGAVFHIPHGISNAVLLPTCMEYAVEGAPERFAQVAKAMGVSEDYDDLELAKEGAKMVKKLCEDIKIPKVIELGIDKEEFLKYTDKMAEDALASGSPGNTYRAPSKEDIIKIYEEIISN